MGIRSALEQEKRGSAWHAVAIALFLVFVVGVILLSPLATLGVTGELPVGGERNEAAAQNSVLGLMVPESPASGDTEYGQAVLASRQLSLMRLEALGKLNSELLASVMQVELKCREKVRGMIVSLSMIEGSGTTDLPESVSGPAQWSVDAHTGHMLQLLLDHEQQLLRYNFRLRSMLEEIGIKVELLHGVLSETGAKAGKRVGLGSGLNPEMELGLGLGFGLWTAMGMDMELEIVHGELSIAGVVLSDLLTGTKPEIVHAGYSPQFVNELYELPMLINGSLSLGNSMVAGEQRALLSNAVGADGEGAFRLWEHRLPMPVQDGRVVGFFGIDGTSPSGGKARFRNDGVDIAVSVEKPVVRAVHSGVVVYSGRLRGLGLVVVIDHGQGLHSINAGLTDSRLVRGAQVDALAPIGAVEKPSGEMAGALAGILHFELRLNGRPVDPLPYINDNGSDPGTKGAANRD